MLHRTGRHAISVRLGAAFVLLCGNLAGMAAEGDREDPGKSAAPDEPARRVAAGNNAFAVNLYHQLRPSDDNLAFSPYSISAALAMTYAGAGGATAGQMAAALHFEPLAGGFHPAWEDLTASIRRAGEQAKGQLHVGNALWGQQGEALLDSYLTLTRNHYGAGFQQVDFAHATEEARLAINDWVADQTGQKIKDLLKRGDVDASTVLVLTNAIYFRADWARQFDPKLTEDGDFRVGDGKSVVVPFMQRKGTFASAWIDDKLGLIELPYRGDRLAFVVIMPKAENGLAQLEASMTPGLLDGWLKQLKPRALKLSMPRFKLNARFSLDQALKALGMKDAFTSAADFSGINGRRGDLYISKVIHQAVVEVNEEGTEAAAATGVIMPRAAPVEPEFMIDRPFMFMIRDRETGAILFMGRVMRP